jgi:hypothetical protein
VAASSTPNARHAIILIVSYLHPRGVQRPATPRTVQHPVRSQRPRKRLVWSWHLLEFIEIVESPPAARGVPQLMYVG